CSPTVTSPAPVLRSPAQVALPLRPAMISSFRFVFPALPGTKSAPAGPRSPGDRKILGKGWREGKMRVS
ncbi:MAG: hypothetical protein J2P35_15795, partial [Actinobacteria bacterium]|nr:hypothetical protein [Actinomycetota bacterium]